MSTTTVPKATGLAAAQAGVVATSFSMLLAGSNATYPLLPVYRDTLGLDPLVISLTFTLYVGFLVPVLFLLARPRFTRRAPILLLLSLATMIPSDLFMAHAQEHLILIGRVLGGIAGGLGTGAASALVVAAIGARGRAVTATGNTIGGIVGVSGAQITVLVLTANAPQAVFIGHAVLTSALLLAAAVVGCDRFIWPRQDGYFRPHFMTRRAPVAVICGPTFNVGFITGWMRRKAGLDGVESGVVRADSKGRPG